MSNQEEAVAKLADEDYMIGVVVDVAQSHIRQVHDIEVNNLDEAIREIMKGLLNRVKAVIEEQNHE
ncbi:MAG: hypothetical protein JKY94_17600 [Rhodobacteraceae bacterium]|nr:hypothetical protein [Paracoccaceae bacterium]